MIIGIFGISGDPPHVSHKAIINECIKRKLVNQVWVCPSYYRNDKKNIACFEDRFKMCKMLFNNWFNTSVKVCDYEKENISGRTYDLVKMFQWKFPQHQFKIIVGEDCADNIDSWYRWEDLIKEFSFIIFSRKDYIGLNPLKRIWYLKKPNRHIVVKCDGCEMSSTFIRKNLIKKENYNLAPIAIGKKNVVNYIIKHNLYKEI